MNKFSNETLVAELHHAAYDVALYDGQPALREAAAERARAIRAELARRGIER